MKTKVTWNGKMKFSGTADSGFTLPLDSSPSTGGNNEGFRPTELVAIGLAACTAMDVLSILQKKRQKLTAFEVNVEVVERAQDHPRVFKHIQILYVIQGTDVDPQAVERAVELSTTKYCSVSAMVEKTAKIEHSYQIIQELKEVPAS